MSDRIEDNNIKTEYPTIDNTGCCYDPVKDITIYNCRWNENNDFIEGYTEDGTKAKYIASKNQWFYGSEISKLNLITFDKVNPDQLKEWCSIGGKKARENDRNKRSLNEIAKTMLMAELSQKNIDEILGDSKNLLQDNTAGSVIIAKMIQTACAGSFKAAEFVRDTAGYNPRELKIDLKADVITDSDRSLLEKIDKRLTG